MHKVAKSVLGYIAKHDLLRAGDRVGVAVSGGADSVALLRILLELRRELGIVLSVVHLNHQLRGSESDRDEQFVRELAAAHDLAFILESRDVKAYAAEKKLSFETAAREVRYQFFREVLESRRVDRIATAHTLDDQAETVVLKLARGAGTRGLAAIYPKLTVSTQRSALGNQHSAISTQHSESQPVGAIIRPLLSTLRIDVESYLTEIGQAWREDSTNLELRHTRNRIRHEVLPQLAKAVNPRVREALAEAAEIARGEEEFWAEEMARVLHQMWSRGQSGGILDREKLCKLTLAEQRRVVRAAAESLDVNLAFQHVEAMLGLCAEGAAAPLPQGWEAVRHNNEIRLQRTMPAASEYEYPLQIPGKTVVAEAEVILDAIVIGAEGAQHDFQSLLHVDPTSSRLIIRNWRAGDRFWPAHAKEPKKIKELLQDRHITGHDKRIWPVIAIGEEVVWVRGFGLRRDFQSKNGAGVLIQDFPMER